MAERLKDAQDRLLDSMFSSEPLADDGFSSTVVRKLSRRLWIRRVTLPSAAAIGAALSIKPLTGLSSALVSIASLVPIDFVNVTTSVIPQAQMIVFGAVLFGVCVLGARTLADW